MLAVIFVTVIAVIVVNMKHGRGEWDDEDKRYSRDNTAQLTTYKPDEEDRATHSIPSVESGPT